MNIIYLTRKYPTFLKNFFKYNRYIRFLSESTCQSMFQDINIFLDFLESRFDINKFNITPNILDNLISKNNDLYYLFVFYLKNELNNEPITISRKVYTIKKLFLYLYENNLIKIDYTKQMEFRKVKKKRIIKHLTLDETKKYLEISGTNEKAKTIDLKIRNYCICNLFLNLGIRVGELSKIQLNDISLSDKTILIHGKGSKDRLLYLNNSSLHSIKEYLKVRPILEYSNPCYNSLFISSRKTKLSKRSIQLITKELFLYVNREELSTHKLRSTYVNILYNNICDLNKQPKILVFSNILGHNSLNSMDNYLNFNQDRLNKLLNNFDNILNRKEENF